MRCYRKILHISCKGHATNEDIGAKFQQAIGPHEDLLNIVKNAKCSGMVMSVIHHVWPKPSYKAEWKGEEDKADRGRGGERTLGNGQAWSSLSPRGQWRTGKNGVNWLRNHLWLSHRPSRLKGRWDEMKWSTRWKRSYVAGKLPISNLGRLAQICLALAIYSCGLSPSVQAGKAVWLWLGQTQKRLTNRWEVRSRFSWGVSSVSWSIMVDGNRLTPTSLK